ncbi:alpha/beta hydrolase [Nevskia soli]|uniref:alpha/beta hydrolase n=1 Tax=Nevskia soli TaxID=418856 RepID=UPI00068C9ED5|nr:alpha/beta fold hydrolase [Nevskia soli]
MGNVKLSAAELAVTVEEVEFPSHGVTLRGGHFLPAAGAGQESLKNARGELPCVVMAHGLGGTRAAGLEPFARRFAAAGLHVLCFDYRYFGKSDGEPRQWVSVGRQLQDFAVAIAYARTLPGVDASRIATWGSSFSGAHSVAAAVADGKIAAVSSQGAMMDGFASLLNLLRKVGPVHVLKLTAFGLADGMRGALGLGRVRIPVVGMPGENAALTTPDSKPGYLNIAPADWRNEITCTWALGLAMYRPNTMTPRLPCPALFCIATGDVVVPPGAMEDGARRSGGKVEVKRYPIGHFDIYVDEGFENASRDQTEFFVRVLKAK